MKPDDLLTQADIARMAGISRQRVSVLVRDGKLPPPSAQCEQHGRLAWERHRIDAWLQWRKGA